MSRLSAVRLTGDVDMCCARGCLTHEDQAHEIPRLARFVPLLSSVGILRLLGVSFGPRIESLAPSVQRFARATRFRTAGYQAAADEIVHIRESASEDRSSRRKVTIPLWVVTGTRGADATWRDLQRDQLTLSEREVRSLPNSLVMLWQSISQRSLLTRSGKP